MGYCHGDFGVEWGLQEQEMFGNRGLLLKGSKMVIRMVVVVLFV